IRYVSVLGSYVAGVGINSVAPARGGDLVKLYLIKHRIPESSYATLAPTLLSETIVDFLIAGALIVWALWIGVLPTHEVYSRLPSVDWGILIQHREVTGVVLLFLLTAHVLPFFPSPGPGGELQAKLKRGFAILGQPRRFLVGVVVPQAISWVLRLASMSSSLAAFGVHASVHNALLAQVVDSLATLFPATPGGAGTKQGLIVYLFRGSAISKTALLAFSVGMNIALTVFTLVLGLTAIGLMARTLSFKRIRLAR